MINELDLVALTKPLPAHHLATGAVGTIVMVFDDKRAFTLEFTAFDGSPIAIVTVAADHVRLVRPREVVHARELAT